jgi:predicted transposase YdaD
MMALSQAYLEWEQQTEQRGEQKGRTEGEQIGEARLILRLLKRRVGTITPDAEAQVRALSLPQLEALGEALLDFSVPNELGDWLRSH